jgi:hypothetical protein
MGKRPIVFTLVHGTWGWNADFLRSESILQQTIRETFSDAKFEKFSWSGLNSHSARVIAANSLVENLKNIVDENPDADHYLITHSHGGNVALYAQRQYSPVQLKGIVCMGTPFLEATVQAEAISVVSLLLTRLGLIFLALLLVFAAIEIPDLFGLPGGVEWLLAVPALLCIVGVWEASTKKSIQATKNLLIKLKLLAQTYSTETEPKLPVFCIVARGDEPKSILGFLDRCTQIPLFADSVIVLAVVPLFLSLLSSYDHELAVYQLAFVPFAIIMFFVGILGRSFILGRLGGFSPWNNAMASLLRFQATERVRATAATSFREYIPTGKGLHHSWLYSDPTVVGDINLWVKSGSLSDSPEPILQWYH